MRYLRAAACILIVLSAAACNQPSGPDGKEVTSIELSGAAFVSVGESPTISVRHFPEDAPAPVLSWSSDDAGVVLVDDEGGITPVANGTAVISAYVSESPHISDEHSMVVYADSGAIIADHTVMNAVFENRIPVSAIHDAKAVLQIGYGRTSHGRQITRGMGGFVDFVAANNGGPGEGTRFSSISGNEYGDDLFAWSNDGSTGLHLFEGSGYTGGSPQDADDDHYLTLDLGSSLWEAETRHFLAVHPECNVIMWAWCGDVDECDIVDHYLNPMQQLETEFPAVTFVYMTGHVEGGSADPAENAVLAANNEIRSFCLGDGKVLFDFADIDKYDLDGGYFGDLYVQEDCSYQTGNWGLEWQAVHIEDAEWYVCGADYSHTQEVNANQKAYAAWWLWARLAGWDGTYVD